MDMVIFTGKETEEEFLKKRAAEHERLAERGPIETTAVVPPLWLKNLARIVGSVVILTGFVLLVLTLMAFFKA